MFVLWYIFAFLGLLLELAVLAAMLQDVPTARPAYRRYPILFLLCVIMLCSSVVETAASIAPASFSFTATEQYKLYYWVSENVIQFFTFLLMISFIHRALDGVTGQLTLCLGLVALATLILGISLGLSGVTFDNYQWMTPLSRNLSFCSALLNLVLWSALLRQKQREPQLLTVSAGLGLATTGKAIGHSLRYLSTSAVLLGNLAIVGTTLLCLFLWWYSFSRQRVVPRTPRRGRLSVPRREETDADITTVSGIG